MTKSTRCSVPECGRPVTARGWCNKHWKRWRRSGDPLGVRPPHVEFDSFEECWAHYVRQTEHGLVWGGPMGGRGNRYGRMYSHGRRLYAHRYAWERSGRLIPEGMELDHPPSCPKDCVTVAHLTLLTKSEHSRLGFVRGEKGTFGGRHA
jgi:hypothetical protein